MSHLANFNEGEELVHLLVETGRPNLSLQDNTFSDYTEKKKIRAQCRTSNSLSDTLIFKDFPKTPKNSGALTLSSTISMEKSFPSPRELLHVLMPLLLVTRARMVHLPDRDEAMDKYFNKKLVFGSFYSTSVSHIVGNMNDFNILSLIQQQG